MSSGSKNFLRGRTMLIKMISFEIGGRKAGHWTYRDVDPGATKHVVDVCREPASSLKSELSFIGGQISPSCIRSNVTLKGRPYVFRTSMENKHQLSSSTCKSFFRAVSLLLSPWSSFELETACGLKGRISIRWHSSMWYTVTNTGYDSRLVWKTSDGFCRVSCLRWT